MVDTSKPEAESPPPRPGGEKGPTGDGTEEVDQLVAEAGRMARGRPLLVGFVIGLVIAVATVVFIIQNTHTVDMEWLWFSFGARVWVSLAVAFIAGAIASPLVLLGIAHFRRRRAKRLEMVERAQRSRRGRRGRRGRRDRVKAA